VFASGFERGETCLDEAQDACGARTIAEGPFRVVGRP
jgi:hypothetical protein